MEAIARGVLETFYVMDDVGDKGCAVNPTTRQPYSADGRVAATQIVLLD